MPDISKIQERRWRALLRRAPRWRPKPVDRHTVLKQFFWALAAFPVLLAGAQFWHRIADGLGSRPVREVRSLLASDPLPTVESPAFLGAMAGLTETTMVPGHRLELLLDGPTTLARIEAEIREARHSVMVQTYSCAPGRVIESLKTLLMDKARQGLHVMFLRDGFGCMRPGPGFVDSLRAAGVEVAVARPLHWYSLHRALHRSHVRSVILDGAIAYTGGFGFADHWLPDEKGPAWRETTIRFQGPAVGQLTGTFAISWADATGEVLAGDGMFPRPSPSAEGAVAGVMFTTRTYGTPVPERYLALAIAAARRTVYIANPYFIPNAELRGWLKDAVARGVDVRVMTSSDNIDVRFTHWASRSTYRELLEAGVRIAEYTPAMLHAKTMVIDGVFGSVGSLNLDNVSLRINDEAVLLAQDPVLGATLDSSFIADLSRSQEITLELFARRPLFERLMTWVASLVRDFL